MRGHCVGRVPLRLLMQQSGGKDIVSQDSGVESRACGRMRVDVGVGCLSCAETRHQLGVGWIPGARCGRPHVDTRGHKK